MLQNNWNHIWQAYQHYVKQVLAGHGKESDVYVMENNVKKSNRFVSNKPRRAGGNVAAR